MWAYKKILAKINKLNKCTLEKKKNTTATCREIENRRFNRAKNENIILNEKKKRYVQQEVHVRTYILHGRLRDDVKIEFFFRAPLLYIKREENKINRIQPVDHREIFGVEPRTVPYFRFERHGI